MSKQLFSIIKNSFSQIIREPIYIILLGISFLLIGMFPHLALFTFGEEEKFLKECSMALILFMGLLVSVFGADVSLSREIRKGNLLFIFSKPVKKISFILAKFLALILSLGLLVVIDMMGFILSMRMIDEHTEVFVAINVTYYGVIFIAFFVGSLSNYLFKRTFTSDTVYMLLLMVFVAFTVFGFISDEGNFQTFYSQLSLNIISAFLLLYLAIILLGSLALGCSVYLEAVPILIVCFFFFILGLVSEYMFHPLFAPSYLTKFFYLFLPNLQYFWITEILEKEGYLGLNYLKSVIGYTICYIGFIISGTVFLFSRKEIN